MIFLCDKDISVYSSIYSSKRLTKWLNIWVTNAYSSSIASYNTGPMDAMGMLF